jgi:hypothetical protein
VCQRTPVKWGECGKDSKNNDGKCIELILMNLRTPYDMFVSTFHTIWKVHKEYFKDYTFEYLCGLLIID